MIDHRKSRNPGPDERAPSTPLAPSVRHQPERPLINRQELSPDQYRARYARPNNGGARLGAGRKLRPRERIISPIGPHWYCIVAQHGEHKAACKEIGLCDRQDGTSGFEIFAPMAWRPAVKTKRDAAGVVHPGRPPQLVPLFGRFIFVKLNLADPDWRRILTLDGVDRIMCGAGSPGSPSPVPDGAIEFVMDLDGMESNGCVYPPGRFDPDYEGEAIPVGLMTRILDGSLADRKGICQWSDTRRVRLLMNFFGRGEVPTTITRRNAVPATAQAVDPVALDA